MNKKLIDWYLGGASYDSDYQAWLTQIVADGGTQPSASVKTAQNALVVGLKAASLWTRMKAGWFLHAGDKTTCRRNIKDPSTFRMSEVGTVTFSEGNGCKSDGSSCWNTTYASNQYAGIQTDITSVILVTESSTGNNGYAFGARTASASENYVVLPRNGGGSWGRFGAGTAFTSANHKSLYVDTYDGTNKVMYKDGVKTSAVSTPVAPTIAAPLLILARNSNAGSGVTAVDFYTLYVGLVMLFDRFSDSDESTLRGLITTYRTAAGLP